MFPIYVTVHPHLLSKWPKQSLSVPIKIFKWLPVIFTIARCKCITSINSLLKYSDKQDMQERGTKFSHTECTGSKWKKNCFKQRSRHYTRNKLHGVIFKWNRKDEICQTDRTWQAHYQQLINIHMFESILTRHSMVLDQEPLKTSEDS